MIQLIPQYHTYSVTGTCGPWVGKGHLPSSSSPLLLPFSHHHTPTEPWGCPRTAGGCLPPSRPLPRTPTPTPGAPERSLLRLGRAVGSLPAQDSVLKSNPHRVCVFLPGPAAALPSSPPLPCPLAPEPKSDTRPTEPPRRPSSGFFFVPSAQLSQLVEETRSERHAILFCLTSPPLHSALNSSPLSFFSTYTQKLLLL